MKWKRFFGGTTRIPVVFGVSLFLFVIFLFFYWNLEENPNIYQRKHHQNQWRDWREVSLLRAQRQLALMDQHFPANRWNPNATISYLFDSSIDASDKLRDVVREALGFWSNNSCVSFSETNGTTTTQTPAKQQQPTVRFYKGTGCHSEIGRPLDPAKKELRVSVSESCAFLASIAHIVGHLLGLLHTHQRPDRDNYVQVMEKDLPQGMAKEFAISSANQSSTMGVPYDYGSVMHYTGYNQKTGRMLMKATDARYQHTMGNTNGPTFLDLLLLNRYYACDSLCQNLQPQQQEQGKNSTEAAINCSNQGFPNPKNCSRCVCPGGFGGVDCSERAAPSPDVPQNCGQSVVASSEEQTLTGRVMANELGQILPSTCHFQIWAPLNSFVQVNVTEIGGRCTPECAFGAVEVKFENVTKTGARICCPEHLKELGGPLISAQGLIIVGVSSFQGESNFTLNYRTVPSTPPQGDSGKEGNVSTTTTTETLYQTTTVPTTLTPITTTNAEYNASNGFPGSTTPPIKWTVEPLELQEADDGQPHTLLHPSPPEPPTVEGETTPTTTLADQSLTVSEGATTTLGEGVQVVTDRPLPPGLNPLSESASEGTTTLGAGVKVVTDKPLPPGPNPLSESEFLKDQTTPPPPATETISSSNSQQTSSSTTPESGIPVDVGSFLTLQTAKPTLATINVAVGTDSTTTTPDSGIPVIGDTGSLTLTTVPTLATINVAVGTEPTTTPSNTNETIPMPTPPPTPASTAGGTNCVDDRRCGQWAANGFCEFVFVEKGVQKRFCPKVCGFC